MTVLNSSELEILLYFNNLKIKNLKTNYRKYKLNYVIENLYKITKNINKIKTFLKKINFFKPNLVKFSKFHMSSEILH